MPLTGGMAWLLSGQIFHVVDHDQKTMSDGVQDRRPLRPAAVCVSHQISGFGEISRWNMAHFIRPGLAIEMVSLHSKLVRKTEDKIMQQSEACQNKIWPIIPKLYRSQIEFAQEPQISNM